MASTTQKKSTTQRSGSGKSSSSKSSSGRSKKPVQPQKRPIRREVGGVVLLLLTLCVGVSYVGVSALFVDWFALLLRGLFGYGYWLVAPAMLLAAVILLFHHGRPVQLRVTCALLLPVLFGTLAHMALCREEFESGVGILAKLWTSGIQMTSGGAVSGILAEGSVAVFSMLPSVIIFTVLFVVMLMVALRLTVGALIEKHRERPQYEEEPEPERPHIRVVETEPVRPRTAPSPRSIFPSTSRRRCRQRPPPRSQAASPAFSATSRTSRERLTRCSLRRILSRRRRSPGRRCRPSPRQGNRRLPLCPSLP